MADQPKQIKLITPRGVAIYPNINRPDKKFPKNGYPVYGVKLAFVPSETVGFSEFVAKLEAYRAEMEEWVRDDLKSKKEGAKLKSLTIAPVVKAEIDKETGDETGRVLINAKLVSGGKSKDGREFTQKPDIIDSRGTPLKNPPIIYGGSVLKLGVMVFGYYSAKDNEVGVSFRLKAAQIIKLGEKRAAFEFGSEDDGYVGDDDDAPASEFGDETGGTAPAGDQPAQPSGENSDF